MDESPFKGVDGSRPYEGRPCYVVIHRQETDQKHISFWNGELTVLVAKRKGSHEGNIWICFGWPMRRRT